MTARGRADDQIHVVPEQGSDDVMHTLDEDCICGPAVERVETGHGDEWLCVHHSLDGRETREPVLTAGGQAAGNSGYSSRFARADLLGGESGIRERLDAPTAPHHTARCRCLPCTEARHPSRAARHHVTIRLLTTGWKRWRAECVCGWRSRSNSTRLVAEQFGLEHFRPVTSGGGPE